MKNPSFIYHLFILITLFMLSACEKDMSDLTAEINRIKTLPAGRIDEIPEFVPYQNFEYEAQNLRDPFIISDAPAREEILESISNVTSGPKPDIDRIKEPLEEFPLDTLRFKGSVTTADGVKWALIFAPDNTIHRVIEGYYLGQNHGRIHTVRDDKVELIEIVPDGLGNFIERNAALALVD